MKGRCQTSKAILTWLSESGPGYALPIAITCLGISVFPIGVTLCSIWANRNGASPGKPMLFFGKYALALGAHLPLGMAGAMLPYCYWPRPLDRQLHGWTFFMGALAAAMTAGGIGTGFLPFLWSGAAVVLLLLGEVSLVSGAPMHDIVSVPACQNWG